MRQMTVGTRIRFKLPHKRRLHTGRIRKFHPDGGLDVLDLSDGKFRYVAPAWVREVMRDRSEDDE